MARSTKTIIPRSKDRRNTSDYYLLIDMTSGEVLGRIIDLSQDGFKLVAHEKLSEASYNCQLSLPRYFGNVRDIPFKATLKWCIKNKRSDWFEAGFQLDQISAPAKEALDQVIEEMGDITPVIQPG